VATILIIAGTTVTRPDALIGNLLYKYIELQLFPPDVGEIRLYLGLMLDLRHIKGGDNHKEFGFHEEDTLIHDPVLYIIFHGFADSAFKNSKLTSPEQIYKLKVPEGQDRLQLQWDDDWKDRPLFRDIDGLEIALEKAIKYPKVRGALIHLG
jgi:hypothetical protein